MLTRQIKIYRPGAFPHRAEYEIGRIWIEIQNEPQLLGMEIEPKYIDFAYKHWKKFVIPRP